MIIPVIIGATGMVKKKRFKEKVVKPYQENIQ
jgi:hypothetical protein